MKPRATFRESNFSGADSKGPHVALALIAFLGISAADFGISVSVERAVKEASRCSVNS
jgi:hypothetical protein